MKQEDRGNDAPFILNAVERAIIRVPRSSHHGLTKIPAAVNIAGKTYLDLARLTDIDPRQLPQVVLAAPPAEDRTATRTRLRRRNMEPKSMATNMRRFVMGRFLRV